MMNSLNMLYDPHSGIYRPTIPENFNIGMSPIIGAVSC
jgi:hypothetical protein